MVPGCKRYCGQLGCVDPYLAATNLSEYDGRKTSRNYFERLQKLEKENLKKRGTVITRITWLLRLKILVHSLMDCDIYPGRLCRRVY